MLVFCERSRFHYIWCAALGNSSQKTCTLLSSWREWQLYQTLTGSLNEIIVFRFLFQVIFLVLPFSPFYSGVWYHQYFDNLLLKSIDKFKGISSLFYIRYNNHVGCNSVISSQHCLKCNTFFVTFKQYGEDITELEPTNSESWTFLHFP